MPRSPPNRSYQEINEEIKILERDITTTEFYCNRTINDIKSEIKRLKDLIKFKSPTKKSSRPRGNPKTPPGKPKPPPGNPKIPPGNPKTPSNVSYDIMKKRLQEKKDTLQLLRSLGEDTKVVEDEIKEIQDFFNSSHSIDSEESIQDEYNLEQSAEELPTLKVLFFDLDDTIVTSADPSFNVTRVRKELIKLGELNIAPPGKPEELSETITTKEIIKLLEYCTRRDDIKWFIISMKNNVEKVEQLSNYAIKPDNDDFGVSMFKHNNKRKSIEKLLRKLNQNFYIPDSIFIDDTREHTEAVSKIDGVRVIDVPGRKFNVSWFPITLMTKENCDECMRYLSGSRAASKRTQKKGKMKSINTKKIGSKKGRSKKGSSKKGRSKKGRSKRGRSKKNK